VASLFISDLHLTEERPEANERFGFARLKSEASGELLHSELYPEEGEEPGHLGHVVAAPTA
jgi:hypothetical protein